MMTTTKACGLGAFVSETSGSQESHGEMTTGVGAYETVPLAVLMVHEGEEV